MTTTAPVRRHALPNGLEVAYQSKAELLQFYDDIFEKRVYTRHGIALPGDACVFDVGANVGLFTVFIAHRFPAARVFAFEPAPPLFDALRANAAPYGDRVALFNCGLSRRAGSAELTFYPHSSGMSSFYPEEGEEKAALRTLIRNELAQGKEGVADLLRYEDELVEQRFRSETWTCALRTLSDVIRERGVTRIDLLKVDVEKSEMDVLAGIADEDWEKIGQAVLEVHDLGDRLREIAELFRSRGFAVTVEQDELYRDTDRWNVYALREDRRLESAGLETSRTQEGIAVVGMAGRFPGAPDIAALWRNLCGGVESITFFSREEMAAAGNDPALVDDPRYVAAAGVLPDIESFDAPFFGFSPREAEIMDPQHRLFLECAWEALENAGYDTESYSGTVGIFGGMGLSQYLLNNLITRPEVIAAAGPLQIRILNDKDFLVSLAAFKLNLTGPSINVQTACSTSLVATCLACQSLNTYQCDAALAGGVSLSVPQVNGAPAIDSIMSPDGHCRAFDAEARGTVGGNGAGVVVLKRLADALADGDTVHAVIKGFATNNDGSFKLGYTAPGVDGQIEVIAMAQAVAGIRGDSITYVEAHGTGTPLGDPVEVEALTEAFRSAGEEDLRPGSCALGSIKTNIGHLDAAAGVASLIKTVLALEHALIPPSLHFRTPNPQIDFAGSPFFVPVEAQSWRTGDAPRRAGVSSFALGGVNAHVILEEAPVAAPGGPAPPWVLLPLSARTETALERRTVDLIRHLREHPEMTAEDFADTAYTLQLGRRAFRHRRVLVCRGREDALACLEKRDPRRLLGGVSERREARTAFLFPGLGNHHVGMARGLYQAEPRFRATVDECAELLIPELGADLRSVLWGPSPPTPSPIPSLPPGEGESARREGRGLPSPGGREGMGEGPGVRGSAGLDLRALLGRGTEEQSPADLEAAERLARTELAQPAVFVIEIALARLLTDMGLRPDALLGFSIGEYVAACLSGVMELPDALRLVARRARLIGSLPAGAMLAVPLSAADAEAVARMGRDLSVAAVIGPALSVLAGPEPAVAEAERRLTAEGHVCRRLQTTHAFHSRMMDPILAPFRELFRGIELRAPEIPFVSNVTGTWITAEQARSPAYWAEHLRKTVRFGDGLGTLWREPERTLVEVGPGQTLASWALQHPGCARDAVIVPAMRHAFDRQDDLAFLLTALGRLWLAGVRLDWAGLWGGRRRRRVPLPTYPFERQRYWIERAGRAAPILPTVPDEGPLPGEGTGRAGTVMLHDAVVHARPEIGVAYAEPRDETERTLTWMWREMLGLDRVGAHDSFFDLGGDSLLATRLVSRLNETFGVALTLRAVFEAPTVAELAAVIGEKRRGGEVPAHQGIVRRSWEGARRPLSFAQRRLWFLDQLEPGNPFYNVAGASELRGPLDPALVARTFEEIVCRHETLRTAFEAIDGEPFPVVTAPGRWQVPLVDLSGLMSEGDGMARPELMRLARIEARTPFDLGRAPLLRTTLIRLDPQDHALFLTMHHIVSDGWSNNVLLGEMTALYAAFSQGLESPLSHLPIQYTDFAAWQIEQLAGGILAEQLAWWRQRLAGLPPCLDLPTDRPRPAVQTFRGAQVARVIPAALTAALRRLGRAEGGTLFMTLLTALAAFLYRHTGQEDFAIGVPIANRTRREIEGLIGFFTNTLVLRMAPAGRLTLRELLRTVRGDAQEAFLRQDLPFEKLVEELQPRRDLSRTPFFQVMLLSTPLGAASGEGLDWQRLEIDPEVARFDLLFDLSEIGDRLSSTLEYSTDLFDSATAERLESRLRTLLEAAVADPDRALADLPLLTAEERSQLFQEWNGAAPARGAEVLAHWRVAEQAARTPDAVAVIGLDGEKLTYRDLDERANRLAHHLSRLGVGPETRVALSLERSPELLVAVLAVLRAGGAYVPLDPGYPAERRALMLEDSGAALLLTRQDLLGLDLSMESGAAPPCAAGLDNLAYVLYTSGSTGRPKGVAMVHRALANLIAWQTGSLPGAWRTLQFTSLSFDVSFQEIFATWAAGGALVLISEEDRRDPSALLAVLRASGVERLFLPFIALQQLAEAAREEESLPERLREVITAGEQLRVTPAVAELFARLPGARLHNQYGPTEAHVVTQHILGEKRPHPRPLSQLPPPIPGRGETSRSSGSPLEWPALPPIGCPLPGVRTYVMDRDGGAAPLGVAGELMLGGVCIARGYLGRPDLTADRFVPDPFASDPGARLYRTGDRARWISDGDLEILGRLDDQVKIRGYRVEPGEVEAALGTHPAVTEAVVGVLDRGEGDRRLVAWVVTHADPARHPEGELRAGRIWEGERSARPDPSARPSRQDDLVEAGGVNLKREGIPPLPGGRECVWERGPGGEGLRAYLADRLPEHAVPSAFVFVDSLPLTPSGKVDRRRLVSLTTDLSPEPAAEHTAPRNPTEERLAGIWSEVLGVPRVGVHDDFFTLGGHSLLATRVTSRVRRVFGVALPVRALFEAPTVAGLAARIESLLHHEDDASLVRVPRTCPLPLSYSQERIWFLDRLQPGLPAYNLPVAADLHGSLDTGALVSALNGVVRRHEALRTVFRETGGSPVQEVLRPSPLAVPVIDLQPLPEAARNAEAERLAGLWVRRPFDLGRGPLLTAALLRLEVERHRLLVVMHHIASDGWSIGILLREISAFYREERLPELPLQYADFAVWQRGQLRGETLDRLVAAWRKRLDGAPPALDLPTDRPRPAAQTFQGANALFSLNAETTAALSALALAEGATLFMVLLAAWQSLLQRLSHQDDLVIGTPVAGRGREEVEDLIGVFINTLALRGDLSGDPPFRELVARAKETALEAYALQDLPFEKLVEELQPVRDLSRSPLFQVMLVLQNTPLGARELPGLILTPLDVESGTAKFDLLLTLVEAGGGLTGALEHNTALFDRGTAKRLLGCFSVLLRAAAADPGRRLSDLPLLTEAEADQLVRAWNDTAVDWEDPGVPEQIAQQARRDPGAVAVVFEGETLTRGDLDTRAERLAERLRALGAGPETLVAVLMERSLDLMVALLAVWKTGAAYLPLDPEDPRERIAGVLAAARPVALLTQERFLGEMPDLPNLKIPPIAVDDPHPLTPSPTRTPATRERGNHPTSQFSSLGEGGEGLAYVIYTSGSTGAPKGAMLHHGGLRNRLLWMQEAYRLRPGDAVLQKTPITFDVSVWELFWPLLAGVRLVLARPGGHRDPRYLVDLIARERVTVTHFVPSMLRAFLDDPALARPEACRSLRLVITSGEALPPDLTRRFFARIDGAGLHNLYGPTEASIDVTAWPCERAEIEKLPSIPIGLPIANTRIHLLGPDLRVVPIGVPGELYIGGVPVGRGYLGRPDLTAERFVPDPFPVLGEAGARLYRTGDLARRRPDGAVEYLGRIDHQVKVRGVRIELGEIEAALGAHPAVREAAVVLRQDSAGPSLVACIVPSVGEPAPAELRAFLRRSLPEPMVPTAFLALPSLPLTRSGKVDRRALVEAGSEAGGAARVAAKEYAAPRTPLEEWLVARCAELLSQERVGIQDNFFDLGGHSLLATQLLARLRDEWRIELPLQDLFSAPDLAALADRITERELAMAAESGALDEALAELDELSPEELRALLAGER